jgi:hypothetical protein
MEKLKKNAQTVGYFHATPILALPLHKKGPSVETD